MPGIIMQVNQISEERRVPCSVTTGELCVAASSSHPPQYSSRKGGRLYRENRQEDIVLGNSSNRPPLKEGTGAAPFEPLVGLLQRALVPSTYRWLSLI
jgi:hypothetical protein